jgi:hypothetical protein
VDRLLLTCGLIAGPLFVAVFLSEGWTRGGYDVFRHSVSSLALGSTGWTQTANFLVGGALTIAFAVGLWRASAGRVGATLIGVWGIGLIGAGLFVVWFLLAGSGFAQTEPFVDVAGLFQRLAVVTGFAWTVAVAHRLVSRP